MEEFFNLVVRENTARAVHAQAPLGHEQLRAKWKRVLESHAATTSAPEPTQHTPGNSNNATNARGRGGTSVRGRGGRGAGGRGGGGASYNRISPRTSFQAPIATLNGVRACFGFNSSTQPCTRQMRDATHCAEPGPNGSAYVHCCSHWDPATKKHCLSLAHNRLNGGH